MENDKKFVKKSKEEFEQEKAAKLESQKVTEKIIEDAVKYLNTFVADTSKYRVSMRDLVDHLITNCGYKAEDIKPATQFNYIILDLANANKNKHITAKQINLRIDYIKDRLVTSFIADEIRSNIEEMFTTYKLFTKVSDSN